MEVQTVQAIASSSLNKDTIPAEFIRSENEQPAITTTIDGPEIPTIDLGELDKGKLVRQIANASEEWGIFRVVNHGIPSDLIHKLKTVGKEFFELLSQEEKQTCAKPPDAKDIEGYGTKLQIEDNKSWADHLFHRIWPPSRINYQFWPKNPPSYREVNAEYAKYMRSVGDKLFEYLSLGLGVEGNALKEAAGGEKLEYLLKINYYPPCPRPDLTLGVGAHNDLCTLTILMPNEVPGLQVYKDDRWFDAKYIPGALVIHIGDQIQILSNGRYKSILHRTTVVKDKARMSWPVFLEPPGEFMVGPLPQLVDDKSNPAKFKTQKFKDYCYCNLNKITTRPEPLLPEP